MFRSIDPSLKFWLPILLLQECFGKCWMKSPSRVCHHAHQRLTHSKSKHTHHPHQTPVAGQMAAPPAFPLKRPRAGHIIGLTAKPVSLPSSYLEGFKALYRLLWSMAKLSLVPSLGIWGESALTETNRNKNIVTQRKHTSQLTTSGRPSCSQ